MYTKRTVIDFFFGTPTYTEFFKNNELVAVKLGANWQLIRHSSPIELTRAQGFKYWGKYFSDKACWSLPQVLQDAIDREPRASGVFYTRNGELCGYEG